MSFWRNYYHLVWATKQRSPFLQPDVEKPLYAYMINKAAELEVYAINGWVEHTHLVVAIPPKHGVAEVVKKIKGASSHYVNHALRPEYEFAWQRGYGCMTMGERQRSIAEAYVRNQKQHHAQQTTNGWLERYQDYDEGPPETKNSAGSFVREAIEPYDWGEFPF